LAKAQAVADELCLLNPALLPCNHLYSRKEREMFRRHRNQHPDAPVGIHRYQMRQKLLAFGHDYYIENEQGQRVFDKRAAFQGDIILFIRKGGFSDARCLCL
jgi:hypothetical protein